METIKEVIVRTPSATLRERTDLTKLGMERYYPAECKSGCPVCGGLGYVRREMDLSNPEFGKLFPCPNSHYRLEGSGLVQDERLYSWGDIKDFGNVRGAVKVVLEVLERGYGWIYLWGGYGTAKTLILKVAVAVCLQLGAAANYLRMAEALQYIREAFDEEVNPMSLASRRLEFLAEFPVLALDEIDRFNLTGFAKEQVFLLMDKRYEKNVIRRNGVTLIASNKPPDQMDGYLADRILDGRNFVYQLQGESVRPLME